MTVVFGQDRLVGEWVAVKLGYSGFDGNFLGAIGVAESGSLIGGTVFHNHYAKEGVVEMTSASTSPRWLTRRMIRAIFSYAFDLLECQMVVLRVSETNIGMVNIAERFKFSGYLIHRLRGKNEAEWVFTFTDDQWRESPFRRKPDGQSA